MKRALLVVLTFCLTLAGMTPIAVAEDAADHVQPVVTRQQFAFLLTEVGLDYDSRKIADEIYANYASEIDSLIRATDEAAVEAGRDIVDKAHSRRLHLNIDELRQYRVDVLDAYATAWPQLDELNNQLFQDVALFFSPQQIQIAAGVEQNIRREMMLKRISLQRLSYDYAGDGIDVIALVAEASLEKQELNELDLSDLDQLLGQYALDVEQLRRAIEQPWRVSRLALRQANILQDADAVADATGAFLEHWKQLYQLNSSYLSQIGTFLEQQGHPEARTAWENRIRRASFPWLFQKKKPERQYDWLMRNKLDDETRATLTRIHVEYQAERMVVLATIIDMMVSARIERGILVHTNVERSALHGRDEQEAYQSLIRHTGELASIERRASEAIEEAVEPSLRQQLKRIVR